MESLPLNTQKVGPLVQCKSILLHGYKWKKMNLFSLNVQSVDSGVRQDLFAGLRNTRSWVYCLSVEKKIGLSYP